MVFLYVFELHEWAPYHCDLASLRPPATQETKETKGRKSARKTRAQKPEIDNGSSLDKDRR